MGAFADYTPGSGAGAEAASAAPADEEGDQGHEDEEGEGHDEEEGEASASGGDYPPHTVAGLPALSPTMSQGNILGSHHMSPRC